MMTWLKVFIALLPLIAELVRIFRRNKLTQEATAEVLDDLKDKTRVLVAEAVAARSSVDHSPSSVQNDEFNRDKI